METLLSKSESNGRAPHSRQNEWNIGSDETPELLTNRERQALEGVKFIADHLQEEHEENKVISCLIILLPYKTNKGGIRVGSANLLVP